MPYALLLFIIMPIVEIAVLLRVGDAIGWLSTLAVVILTAVLGTAMLRQQGVATLNTVRQRLGAGEMPAQQILEGVLLLVGGLLLLTPGFVTDAFGFVCLVPVTRQALANWLKSRSKVHMAGVGAGFGPGMGPGGPTAGSNAGPTAGPRVDPRVGAGTAAGQSSPRPQPPGSDGRSGDSSGGSGRGEVIDGDFRRID